MDRRAAEARARELERDSVDPDHAAAAKATLTDAQQLLLKERLEQANAGRRRFEAVHFYGTRAHRHGDFQAACGSGQGREIPMEDGGRGGAL